MKNAPELFITLLFFIFLLVIILVAVIAILRFLKKKDEKSAHAGMDQFADAFKSLGGEIKVLKEQLILKDRLAAMGEISAGIAHQLRNPMAVIAGYSKLLLKSLDENDKRRDMLIAVLKEVEEMNHVMEELFRLSRHEKINKDNIKVSELITNLIASTADKGKKINYNEHKRFIIKGDETLIMQALKNIVQNALDSGGEAWIEVGEGSFSQKEGIFINIHDKGKGISKEDINKIFVPFFTTKEGGIGIGLTMAHKIISAHDGNIAVESAEGKETVFRVFLPK
jgi:signal transduction histidine kinase